MRQARPHVAEGKGLVEWAYGEFTEKLGALEITHLLARDSNLRPDDPALLQNLEEYGLAFDPECVPEPHLDGSQSAHFGIYLINQCMDKADYHTQHPGEKCIRLVKNRLPSPS